MLKKIEKIESEDNNNFKILKISIDGNWTSNDFIKLFESINLLNQIFVEIDNLNLLQNYQMESELTKNYLNVNGFIFKKLNLGDTFENTKNLNNINIKNSPVEDYRDLKIKELKYASPGFADFFGSGEIVKNIFDTIKHYIPNKNQKLQNEILELDIIEKKLNILNTINSSEREKFRIIEIRNSAIENLKQLDFSNKITNIETSSEKYE
ncbi:hypothetical protein [Flavobacterium eburneipallidum]|uniref:hypothetical protein n=1 Tax=Flavobacterium eburneipallidum TaxID=3003263 RepID=UPI00248258A3|nr:hypothetical protein [Flavobacterium eburneipallidum]